MSLTITKTLTDEQSKAVKKIRAFLEDPDKREFLFIGPAGSGKTFTLRFALDSWKNKKSIIAGATISHAAKEVLRNSIGDLANCYTMLQLLGMKPGYGNTGKEYIDIPGKKERPIDNSLLIIVDECSMLDKHMLKILRERAPVNSKIIFTGDDRQLPPVTKEDSESPVFRIKDKAELSVSQRFKGPIGIVAQFYRDYVDYAREYSKGASLFNLNNFFPVYEDSDSRVVFTNNKEYFDESAKAYISAFPDNARILCFKNDLIDSYNESVREMIIGNTSDTIVVGEKVVLNGPIQSQGKDPIYFHNGEIIKVEGIDYYYKKVAFTYSKEIDDYQSGLSSNEYKVYQLYVKDKKGAIKKLHHIHPDSYLSYFKTKKLLKKIAIESKRESAWVNFRKFKESFLDFSYLYAQSSHKAQGQSIDHVFVHAHDILSTGVSLETKLKSLYVAATRAKKTLYVLME